MTYTCKRCLFETPHRHVLKAHLEKKRVPCVVAEGGEDVPITELVQELALPPKPVGKYQCEWCLQTFAQSPSKSRHKTYCSKKPSLVSQSSTSGQSSQGIQSNQALLERIENIEKNMSGVVNNNIVNNNNIQIINNGVINLNDFGKESIDHITSDKSFLTDCVLKLGIGIKNFVERINFDQDHPENMTIKNVKKKQKVFEVQKDGILQICDQNAALHDLINRGYKILYKHFFAECESEDFNDRQDKIKSYFTKIGDSIAGGKVHNEFYELRKSVLVMIHNNVLYLLEKT